MMQVTQQGQQGVDAEEGEGEEEDVQEATLLICGTRHAAAAASVAKYLIYGRAGFFTCATRSRSVGMRGTMKCVARCVVMQSSSAGVEVAKRGCCCSCCSC